MHGPDSRSATPRVVVSSLCALVIAVALWLPRTPAQAIGPQVVESQLACGARLFVSEQRNLPIVIIRVLVDAGVRLDPSDREGLANLTAGLLTEGTTTRSATEISEAIDFIGGALNSWAETDYAAVGLRVLSKDIDLATDLLADVLLRPAFSASELDRRRETVLAGIRNARDNPIQVAQKAFRRAVFEGEPYGHPGEGTEDSVRRIMRSDVKSFYERNYGSARALIVVVGDVSSAEVERILDRKLAAWKQGGHSTFVYPLPRRTTARTVRIEKPVTQAAIVLGHHGVARDNPDFEALGVMNYILGSGGFSSRLTDSIRIQAGLAYSVGSSFAMYKSTGSFQVVMQTKNSTVGEAITRAKRELNRIRDEPVTDQELDEARRYLTGSFPLSLDTLAEVADFISSVAFYGLGWDYADRYLERVGAVTKEDVQRVARQYLHPDALLEVVVADLDRVGDNSGEVEGH
jgi:zinc protease